MATKVRFAGDVIIVEVMGKMMGGPETDECHDQVREVLAGGHKKVVMDLSGAEWVNSRGMGSLMACYVSNQRLGGDLRFAAVTDKTRSLFHIAKLDTVFQVFDTVGDAIASFE